MLFRSVNSVLISIRIASYGHEMEIASSCPSCKETSDYSIDMRNVLDNIARPNYGQTVKLGDIEVFFRPLTLQQQTQVGQDQFETQRMIAAAQESSESDQAKIQAMSEVMKKINQVTVKALAFGISGIRSPQAFVTEDEHITEFLTHCDRLTFSTIRDHAVSLRSSSDLRPMKIICSHCQHEYEQSIELNMSNFFVTAS